MNRVWCVSLIGATALLTVPSARAGDDPRNIRTGSTIPDEGYCDQPYIVITPDGNWLCTMTTGKGHEGQNGQHVVAAISSDRGRTWSGLIDIEPAGGPVASWAMPLLAPSGRVYVFYDYNGDRVDTLGSRKGIRADMLGWYVYKYSDDNGRTWSTKRYRLPVRFTEYDRDNDFDGRVQMFWGIGKPIVADGTVYFGFSKIGKYLVDKSEGWFFRSDNCVTEPDPEKIEWRMLPEGDVGLRAPKGPIAEEQNLVVLSNGDLYTVYRTVDGHPCHAYSRDGARTWTPTAYATYTPGGRLIKHPRACPRLWKTAGGRYLLWYHNHGGKDFNGRNPAWITGGIEKDGFIHWSQPEILLYDPDPEIRISYPDLVEERGRFWVSETQKTVARVHEIDPALLKGLWDQGAVKRVATQGLVLTADAAKLAPGMPMPDLPELHDGRGFTVEMWIRPADASTAGPILDARDDQGKGVFVVATGRGAVRIGFSDGQTEAGWDCDEGLLTPDRPHHLVAIVDGGPKIISFVVDGVLCDGGSSRQYGWGRFPDTIRDVNGSGTLKLAKSFKGGLPLLRIYDRYLRTSEAVANFHAGL